MRQLTIPTVFVAVDRFSQRVNKMTGAMDRFHQAGAKSFAIARTSGMIGLSMLAPMGYAANKAAEFEDKLTSVGKTTQMQGQELKNFGDQVLKMSTKTRTGIDSLLEMAEVGGQLGIAKKDLLAFTDSGNKFFTVFSKSYGGNVEEAMTHVAKLGGIFKETRGMNPAEQISRTASAINELSKQGAATAYNVTDFALRIGALADNMSPSLQNTLALGAHLENLGIKSEIASGGMARLFTAVGENIVPFAKFMNMTPKSATSLFNKDSLEFVKEFASKFKGMSNTQMIQTLDKLKIGTDESKKVLGAMSDSIEKLTKTQKSSSSEFEKNNSINKEYIKMNMTSAGNIAKMRNQFDALTIKVGNAVLPILNSLLKATAPIIEGIANWIERNKSLTETLAKIVVIGGGVAIAISGISFMVGAYQKAVALARIAQLTFNTAILANPYVLAGAAIVGLTGFIMKYTGSIGQANMKQEAMSDISLKVANRFASQQVHIQQLFETLRTSGSKTDEYKDALQKLETIQPGITEKYNLQTKAIDRQNQAQKRLIYTLRQKLEEEVMYETKRDAMKNLIVQRVEMQGLIKKGESFDKQSLWNKDVFGMITNAYQRSSTLEDINKSKSTIDIINQLQKEKQNKMKNKEDQKITVEIKGNNGDAKVTATNGINLLNAVMNQQMPRLSSTTK
jgi:TP901 family phage tail tape measure protein